jgi:hypothetical protein
VLFGLGTLCVLLLIIGGSFTDVVMPHMSGKELADRVQVLFPRTKILFTCAYVENVIVHPGMLNQGVAVRKSRLRYPHWPSKCGSAGLGGMPANR